jgi:hypothetical protein
MHTTILEREFLTLKKLDKSKLTISSAFEKSAVVIF